MVVSLLEKTKIIKRILTHRFFRLKYNSRGVITIDGFSELSDADPDDIEPWLPRFPGIHQLFLKKLKLFSGFFMC